MNYKLFKTGDDFLQYIDNNLKNKQILKLEGGQEDYAILIYDNVFKVYILNDHEYANPYLCGYKMFKTLLETLVSHSTHHNHNPYHKSVLDFSWVKNK